MFSKLTNFFKISTIFTRCINAFLDAESVTKTDFVEEFIVLSYLSKDKQKENSTEKKEKMFGVAFKDEARR